MPADAGRPLGRALYRSDRVPQRLIEDAQLGNRLYPFTERALWLGAERVDRAQTGRLNPRTIQNDLLVEVLDTFAPTIEAGEYWTLELVELFMRSAAPDEVERERLVHSILARLAPIGGRLSSFQQAAVRGLAQEFGWSLNAAPIAASASRDDLSTRLSDKSIAIYSLVENANRQAKAVLESLSSSVDVQLSSEHVGTSRLRALATNSDLFVIAWAAAKHAATDFIREHRGGRPLVYAEGKGLSSLLRAVEDFFGRSAD